MARTVSGAELHFGYAHVHVDMVGGVWRDLRVAYCGDLRKANRYGGALFADKRCEHVRSVLLIYSDINVRIADALAGLRELEHLSMREYGRFEPPPGVWPQLRRLTVEGYMSEKEWNCSYHSTDDFADADELSHIPAASYGVMDATVSALVAAAPNLRHLRIMWTNRLDCLADILAGLPMLETLDLDYANVDHETEESKGTEAILDSKPLDSVTPANLQSMRLRQRTPPPDRDGYDKAAVLSVVELTAALVRMQGRTGNRFTVELMDKVI